MSCYRDQYRRLFAHIMKPGYQLVMITKLAISYQISPDLLIICNNNNNPIFETCKDVNICIRSLVYNIYNHMLQVNTAVFVFCLFGKQYITVNINTSLLESRQLFINY